MSRILNFVREKAFVLILLGSIAAAVGTGVWAIRTVQQNLNQDGNLDQDGTAEELWDAQLKGDDLWDEPADMVTDEMNGEIAMDESKPFVTDSTATPQPTKTAQPAQADGSDAQSTPAESSTESSGASLPSESSETSAVLEPPTVAVAPSFVWPVSGATLQAFSGNELVYNETLGDWRTHNGVDYAAKSGESVIAPIPGEIVSICYDGNWGGVVELKDAQGYLWRFCGVEKSTRSIGESVTVGQELGTIGVISAESTAQPHLHLEILKDDAYQNPSDHLR